MARLDSDFVVHALEQSRFLYDNNATTQLKNPGKRSLSCSAPNKPSPSRVSRSGDKSSPTNGRSCQQLVSLAATTPTATDADMSETVRTSGISFDWNLPANNNNLSPILPASTKPGTDAVNTDSSPRPLTPHHSAFTSPAPSPAPPQASLQNLHVQPAFMSNATFSGYSGLSFSPAPVKPAVQRQYTPQLQHPQFISQQQQQQQHQHHVSPQPTLATTTPSPYSTAYVAPSNIGSTENKLVNTTSVPPLTAPQPSVSANAAEIQRAYYDISKLERECQVVVDQLKGSGSAMATHSLPIELTGLFGLHSRLVERYVDFITFAYHPTASISMRALVKKYKIPYRLWSKGIFRYLELLRHELPFSAELMGKFILHCFSLLSLLVEPPYDSRHIWQEALGDVARFGMAMRISDLNTVYWEDLCKYWYSRASQREPTVGRLYHHISMLSSGITKIFYFSKCMLSAQPFDLTQGGGKEIVIENALARHTESFYYHYALFLKHVHQYETGMEIATQEAAIVGDIWNQGSLALESHKLGKQVCASYPDELTSGNVANFGAMIAYCNIAGVLGVGNLDYNFARAFFAKYGNKPVPVLQRNVFSTDRGQDLALGLMEKSLRFFLNVPKKQSMSHVIVWMHFCLAVHDIPELIRPFMMKHASVLGLIQAYVNETLDAVQGVVGVGSTNVPLATLHRHLIDWCFSCPSDEKAPDSYETSVERINRHFPGIETRGHFPVTRQRPLPEECMLLGSIWPHVPVDETIYHDYENQTNDFCYPGDVGGPGLVRQREIKMIELACRLVNKTSWLDYSEEYVCFRIGKL